MFFPSDIINEVKMAQFNSDESVFRKFIPNFPLIHLDWYSLKSQY